MARVQRLLDERIIRQVTPIFDTRALGYSSMLVAAKVDPEQPLARGQGDQRAPRRLAQLPAQPRVQHLVHDRHRARLAARPGWHARGAGASCRRRVGPPAAHAQAVQDPHGPRDGGRHRRAGQGRGGGRAGRDRAAALRRARHRGDPGRSRATCRWSPSPTRPPPSSSGSRRSELLAHLERDAGAPAAAPRRRDPVPPPRRLQRQRHGRVEGARRADHGARPADGRVPRHLALLPAARPTRTGRTRSSRWPTAAPRRSATRSSTRSPTQTGIDERATLYSSTEFKKIRLLYFTDDYRDWEREHAGA